MKIKNSVGRRTGDAFKLYGFISAKIEGRYVAICSICHKHLQNTAALRLRGHRNICKNVDDGAILPDNLSQTQQTTQSEPNYKKEQMLVSVESTNFENEYTPVEASDNEIRPDLGKTFNKDVKNPYETEELDQIVEYVQENPLSVRNDKSGNIFSDIAEDIDDEDAEILFKKYQTTAKTNNSNTNKQNLAKLQEEKTKAETAYFRNKAVYFQKQTENLVLQKKLMIFQLQKMRLEIEKLRNDF